MFSKADSKVNSRDELDPSMLARWHEMPRLVNKSCRATQVPIAGPTSLLPGVPQGFFAVKPLVWILLQ